MERCQIFWLNSFDQTPYHMNDAGSKETGTLALRGQPVVVMKEGHAATRARWTVNIMSVSDIAETPAVAGAGASFILATVVTSPRGSFREEHVLAYLERHFETWSAGMRCKIPL